MKRICTLHTNRLAIANPGFGQLSPEEQRDTLPWQELVKLWIVGESLGNKHMCNAVVDEMILLAKTCDDWPGIDAINLFASDRMHAPGGLDRKTLFVDFRMGVP